MSGPGDGQDHVGTPQPAALIPALEEGQLTALRRSGASGTGCPLTGKSGGGRCRSTRPWAGIPRASEVLAVGMRAWRGMETDACPVQAGQLPSPRARGRIQLPEAAVLAAADARAIADNPQSGTPS
jgi:hypothetical protein